MKVAICDDNTVELSNTKQQLEKAYKSLELCIRTFGDGNELIKCIEKEKFDLIILDIEMPTIDGLSVAKKLRALGQTTAICFLTSHLEYALKGYEVNAIRYLMKPVKAEQLAEIVQYLIAKDASTKKVMLKEDEDVAFVAVEDILYLEARNQDIRIVTADKEYMRRYNMHDYEEELREWFFVRCHRSYLVNLAHVAGISEKEVVMDNEERIPVSRTKVKKLKELLMNYVKRSAI